MMLLNVRRVRYVQGLARKKKTYKNKRRILSARFR